MIVYSVNLEGKDSNVRVENLSKSEAPFDYEYTDKEAAFIALENHLKGELKSIINKIREIRHKKDVL